MKKEKRNYEAPSLTVVSFKTEKGYAISGPAKNLGSYDRTNYNYDAENNDQTWGTF